MSWVLVIMLAMVVFAALIFALRGRWTGWEAIATALLLGIAGYGLQASPDMPGAPKAAKEEVSSDEAAALVKARQALDGKQGLPADSLVVLGDGLARNGQYADAASVLLAAVRKKPGDGDAWLALANALVAHADGILTPASYYAFQHASEAAPADPGPPFFLGLALAQSGRFAEARRLWVDLLERSPKDAPWRPDLEMRLARLDEFIAGQGPAMQQR